MSTELRECGRGRLRAALSALVLAAATVGLAACDGGGEPPISRAEFVEANVALRMVPDTAARADSLRAAALDSAGVTADELDAWLRETRDPATLSETWREIADSVTTRQQRAQEPEPVGDEREAGGDVRVGEEPVPEPPVVVPDAGEPLPTPVPPDGPPATGRDTDVPPPGSLRDVRPPRADKPPVGDKRPPPG